MRTLTMKKIDLQKLCEECGLKYTVTAGVIFGVYGNDYVISCNGSDFQYNDKILVFKDAGVYKYKIRFCNGEQVHNDENNYNYIKETIIKAVNQYKEKFLELKEHKLHQDFD